MYSEEIYKTAFIRGMEGLITDGKTERACELLKQRVIDLEIQNRKIMHIIKKLTGHQKLKYEDLFNEDTSRKSYYVHSKIFYNSQGWKSLRFDFIKNMKSSGKMKCVHCGATGDAVHFHVDHINPRSVFPELALEIKNLQLLCADCNMGKTNKIIEPGLQGIVKKVKKEESKIILRKKMLPPEPPKPMT